MHEFLRRVAMPVPSRKLFFRGEKILAAISGGVDSMVLLHVLHRLAAENRWKIFIAHFNHQLRGRASDADEKLVRETARKLSLPFLAGRADVKNFAATEKISLEMAARKLRHAFFARVAQKEKIKKIALAHHADDQVELFFLRLLRGAGGEGLAGMKSVSPSPANPKISLVRPLLDFSKNDLREFARENKIRFREDASNASSDFLRNRVRNELLPLLQACQPAIAKTVLRAMEISGAEAAAVSETARAWLARRKTGFAKLPVAVQRKILQRQLLDAGVAAHFELVEKLRAAPEKFVSVQAGLAVARTAAGKILRRENFEPKFLHDEFRWELSRLAVCEFGGGKFSREIVAQKKFSLPPKKFGVEFFDAEKIGGEIILRHWRAGDRFQPIGLKSPAKLQDLFVNAKIPAARRRNLILAATAHGEIFWVEGLRISENFKLTRPTRRRLVWKWSKSAV